MSRSLYVDIDSTIWDLHPWVFEAIYNQHGIKVTEDDITKWNWAENLLGKGWWSVFEEALDPDRVMDRELFPNCAEALTVLSQAFDFDIHFLSHNPKPDKLREPIFKWLCNELDIPFSLTIFGARNDKVDFMKEDESAWGIVEDKGKTLKRADDQAFYAFGKRYSHNQNLQNDDGYGIIWFDDWDEMPELVAEVLEGERIFEQFTRRQA